MARGNGRWTPHPPGLKSEVWGLSRLPMPEMMKPLKLRVVPGQRFQFSTQIHSRIQSIRIPLL